MKKTVLIFIAILLYATQGLCNTFYITAQSVGWINFASDGSIQFKVNTWAQSSGTPPASFALIDTITNQPKKNPNGTLAYNYTTTPYLRISAGYPHYNSLNSLLNTILSQPRGSTLGTLYIQIDDETSEVKSMTLWR